ncbi:hypothetical protein ACN27J_18130 [Solwaraspora sp. WMMB762]|uniref:hypothetical protein n=1 Tax=Solwaraspora sp. WMMB762 TaxID=3404120 RepID=UPI003B962940
MIDTRLAAKYCRERINPQHLAEALLADPGTPTLATELRTALTALEMTEGFIAGLITPLDRSLRDVEQVLVAGRHDQIPLIENTGVLHARGPRLDALLARRAAQIDHLRSLTRLWAAEHPDTTPQ